MLCFSKEWEAIELLNRDMVTRSDKPPEIGPLHGVRALQVGRLRGGRVVCRAAGPRSMVSVRSRG